MWFDMGLIVRKPHLSSGLNLWPVKVQISLLSYRDNLEILKFFKKLIKVMVDVLKFQTK